MREGMLDEMLEGMTQSCQPLSTKLQQFKRQPQPPCNVLMNMTVSPSCSGESSVPLQVHPAQAATDNIPTTTRAGRRQHRQWLSRVRSQSLVTTNCNLATACVLLGAVNCCVHKAWY